MYGVLDVGELGFCGFWFTQFGGWTACRVLLGLVGLLVLWVDVIWFVGCYNMVL